MPQPTPVQRLRRAFDTFLREAQQILSEVEASENVASTIDPKVDEIKAAVAQTYHIPVSLLDARIRRAEAVWPRHVAMYLVIEATHLNMRQVAAAFSRNNHTTATWAYRAVKDAITTSPRLKQEVAQLQQLFPSIH